MTHFTVGEPLILLYISKTVDDWGIKCSVESGWRMNPARAQRYRLMLARDGNKVVGAFRPVPGTWKEIDEPGRWYFRVEPADDVWDSYVGKLVPAGVIGRSNRPVVRYLDEQP